MSLSQYQFGRSNCVFQRTGRINKKLFADPRRACKITVVEQLCFFPFERPLLERFGSEFFKSLPRSPGVYIMFDGRKKVLYVGQSHNLRVRLAYYKNAQPEREPRRIVRLVHRVEDIRIEPCDSPQAAQLRELELIRQHWPRFNVAGALSRTYSFFAWRLGQESEGHEENTIHLRLMMSMEHHENDQVEGAFKGRSTCRRALLGLGRLFWTARNLPRSVYDLPMELGTNSRVTTLHLPFPSVEHVVELWRDFIAGENDGLVVALRPIVRDCPDKFLARVLESDLETLGMFFKSGPARLRELRAFHALTGPISQAELDPLLLLMRSGRKAAKEPVAG